MRSAAIAAGALLLSVTGLTAVTAPAAAAGEVPPVTEQFQAPLCAGTTIDDPQNNGGAVPDASLVFGERLDSYNDGRVVPLYDGYGGTALIDADDNIHEDSSAYPPLCGTRYVEAAGGAVSEWMFCTDRHAQVCGDTNGAGQLTTDDGEPANPMTNLEGNEKLSTEQERLIGYLIQEGHP